jgi:hypothetical protein
MTNKILSFPAGTTPRKCKPRPQQNVALVSLTPDEQFVLNAYFDESLAATEEFEAACDRLEVATQTLCSRVEAAVGQVLVQNVQERLPQWACFSDRRAYFGRKYHKRLKGKSLEFLPQHLFTINWADSGPGFSWPEAYYLAYIPGRNRYVVIASQDSTDVWGCTDQAIGHYDAGEDKLLGAKRLIAARWRPVDVPDAQPWGHLFDTGLVDQITAEQWRREVWCEPKFERSVGPRRPCLSAAELAKPRDK